MPSTYAAASPRPRQREGRAAPPSTRADTMGIMGNTQGVNDSSRPSSRNTPAVLSQPRPPRACARPVSPACNNAPRAGARADAAADAEDGSLEAPDAMDGAACGVSMPSPRAMGADRPRLPALLAGGMDTPPALAGGDDASASPARGRSTPATA